MKRIINYILLITIVFSLLHPTAFAAEKVSYSVSTSTVNMSADGTGSFQIIVDNPSMPYNSAEFLLSVPDGIIISDAKYNVTGLQAMPAIFPIHPAHYYFSIVSDNVPYTGTLTCTVYIKYNKTVTTDKQITVYKIIQLLTRDEGAASVEIESALNARTITVSRGTSGGLPTDSGDGSDNRTTGPGVAAGDDPAALGDTNGSTTGSDNTDTLPGTDSARPQLDKSNLKAYIKGYPDGTLQPDLGITRAEVSSMLYELIVDQEKANYRDNAAAFTDVSGSLWYAEAVGYLSAKGIITGYPEGDFRGDRPITRAEFATITIRFEASDVSGEMPFADVTGHWAYDGILSAYNNKWIVGYPDDTFMPGQNIIRAEALTIVNRVIGRDPDTYANYPNIFSDVEPGVWYYHNVLAASSDLY